MTPSIARVELGASTLARKWQLDVNDVANGGTFAAPQWIGVFGVANLVPKKTPTIKDDPDYEGGGWGSGTVSALAWSIELELERKVIEGTPAAYNPGQEVLRAASDGMGIGNRADVQWYEVTPGGPKVEAYRGYATVSWEPAGGPYDELEVVKCTLTGKGPRTPIVHPDAAAAVPTVASISPIAGAAAGGSLVRIIGTGFAGTVVTTGVKFGATNAPTWLVESDNVIVAVAPAHAAGPVNVVVANATGPSVSVATFTYA